MFCVQLIRYEREDDDGGLPPVGLRGHDDDAATTHHSLHFHNIRQARKHSQ